MKESARTWIERLSQRRERFFRRTYEAGQRMVAEGHIERALEFWSALPDDYEDIVARRKALVARADAAAVAVAAGDRFYEQGDVARAVAEWDKAAALRPGDIELKKRLAAARNQLGNLNLKRTYLREASEEAERRQLRRGAGPLPEGARPGPHRRVGAARRSRNRGQGARIRRERSARTRRRRGARGAESHEPAQGQSAAFRAAVSQADPRGARLPRSHCAGALAFASSTFPGVHAETAKEAEQLFSEAQALKAAGKPSDAIALCSRIAKDYPRSTRTKRMICRRKCRSWTTTRMPGAQRRKPSPSRATSIR